MRGRRRRSAAGSWPRSGAIEHRLNEDFRDILRMLIEEGARFLVVGAHALAVHGVPRATGDLDIWIERDPANSEHVFNALLRFGAPVATLGISKRDLEEPGMVVQIGLPPRRIDLLTDITGVDFATAWGSRFTSGIGDLEVPFLGRAQLIANKRATGRLRDLADLEALGERGG
jgi:hypothetical protein